ncbi:hypothetical protein BT69DRAFT_1355201 [Atractiella rhizophila]|nr:hypothetical protein BT69DRAFT_1355201 [Atractiella rhizophila]
MTKALAADDPKRVRKSRACVHCRNSKSRCEANPPPENENSEEIIILVPPCARCERLGERCEWVASKRKGRPRRLVKKVAPPAAAQELGSNVKIVDRSTPQSTATQPASATTPGAFFSTFSSTGVSLPPHVAELYHPFQSPNLDEPKIPMSGTLAAYQGYLPNRSVSSTSSSQSPSDHNQNGRDNIFVDGNTFEPFEAAFTMFSDSVSTSKPASDNLVELPDLGFLDYLLHDTVHVDVPLTSQTVSAPTQHLKSLPLDSEIYSLIAVFYSRAALFINVLPPEPIFVSHHLPTCSPFLLAAVCAIAQPFWSGQPLSRDYYETAHYLFRNSSCPEGDTPLSRLLGCLFMIQASYGQAKAMVALEYVKESSSIALDHQLYQSTESILVRERREGGFGEDTAKKAWWELFCLDTMAQFATGVRHSALEPAVGKIALELPQDWLSQDDSKELRPPALRLRILSLLLFVTAPPSQNPTTREAQFQSLDLMISNLIVICESMYKATLEREKANPKEEWVNTYHREQAWMGLLMLSSARVRLHHAYKMPDFSLAFQYCSVDPQDESNAQVELVDESQHLIPPALTNGKTPPSQPTSEPDAAAFSQMSLSRLNFVPLTSLKKIVGAGQGVFALMRQESSTFIDLESVNTDAGQMGGEGLLSVPLTHFSPPSFSKNKGSIPAHSPFYSCCQLNASFAILVGIASILIAKNQKRDIKREELAAMEWRVMALLSELDLAEELLRREARIWPVAWIKAEKLSGARKRVLESLRGGKPVDGLFGF